MKNLKLLFLLPLMVFSSVSSQETILNQTTIDKKALVIEQKLKRDRFIMYGLTSLSVAHEVYQWVPLLRDLFSNKSSSTVEEKSLSFFESIKAAGHYLFYTKEGWIAIMQSGVSVGGFFIISEMGKKFIHPNALRWYIHAHAPYDITIKMMQERLVELEDPSLSQEQLRISNEMLHLLYDRLIRQGESMCAFMAYKTKRLDDDEKIIAERSKVLMLKSHNDWLQGIKVQLQSDNRDYQVITKLLESYKNMIQAQANNFAFIEGETGQERRLYIKKQMS